MTDPRIRTIRVWLLLVGSLLACIFWPSLALYLFGSFALSPLGLFMPVFPNTPDPNCPRCLIDTVPAQFQIVISGVVDGGTCVTCPDLDGTITANNSVGTCEYPAGFACTQTGKFTIERQTAPDITKRQLTYQWGSCPPGGGCIVWRTTLASGTDVTDCGTIDEDVPWIFQSGPCDGTSATVHATAL